MTDDSRAGGAGAGRRADAAEGVAQDVSGRADGGSGGDGRGAERGAGGAGRGGGDGDARRHPAGQPAPDQHHGVIREVIEHAAASASRLTNAFAKPIAVPVVSLVRQQRKPQRDYPTEQELPTGKVIACGIYQDGERVRRGVRHTEALRAARRHNSFVWLGIHEPGPSDLTDIARAYGLPPLAVEDAITAHQRPKLERYGHVLFVVLKTIRYVSDGALTASSNIVETGEVMVFVGADFVITVRHGEYSGLKSLRSRLEAEKDLLERGPAAVLYAICDQVVDDMLAVTENMQVDVDTMEGFVFDRASRPDPGRVYQLKREILEFKHAVLPLAAPIRHLRDQPPGEDEDGFIREHFRDVADHIDQVAERVNRFDELLTSILQATLAQVAIVQNEDMRRMSAWVAIAVVPTVLAGIYGMNFEHMPELREVWGYPAVLALMATICFTLYRTFKRNGWL